MTKDDYYEIYSGNLRLLERQMELVKKSIQISLGKKEYLLEVGRSVESINEDIKAQMRVFGFLMCSWFEARLNKILYESSNEGFSDHEISTLRNIKIIGNRWKEGFNLAICKKYSFSYSNNTDYSTLFSRDIDRDNYIMVRELISEIDTAILVRNRLAHGQWEKQLNSHSTAIITEVNTFFSKYSNIQKMSYLFDTYKEIANIISDAIVSKNTYERDFEDRIKKINKNNQEMDKRDFKRYCKPFLKKEKKLKELYCRNSLMHTTYI